MKQLAVELSHNKSCLTEMKQKFKILIVDDDRQLWRNISMGIFEGAFHHLNGKYSGKYELEWIVIDSDKQEGESGPEYIEKGMQALVTQEFDFCIFDWNVGTKTIQKELDLHSQPLIRYAELRGIEYRICSGSSNSGKGDTLSDFLNEMKFETGGKGIEHKLIKKSKISSEMAVAILEPIFEKLELGPEAKEDKRSKA